MNFDHLRDKALRDHTRALLGLDGRWDAVDADGIPVHLSTPWGCRCGSQWCPGPPTETLDLGPETR